MERNKKPVEASASDGGGSEAGTALVHGEGGDDRQRPGRRRVAVVDAAGLMELHRVALSIALKKLGVSIIRVTYEGSGDEGQPCEISTEPEGVDLDSLLIRAASGEFSHRARGVRGSYTWGYKAAKAQRVAREVFEQCCELALQVSGHHGFEDGAGGYGSLTLDVTTGTLTLEHNDYVEAVETSHHVFASGSDVASVMTSESAAKGLPHSGAGDEARV